MRPFFNAYGITAQQNTSCITRSQHSQINNKVSSFSDTAVADALNAAKDELAAAFESAAIASQQDDDNDRDSSSMVVLARPKRKHSLKQEGTDSNSGRSGSSLEGEAHLQQQQQLPLLQAANDDEIVQRNGGDDQDVVGNPQQQPQQQQNLLGNAQRFGFPTMVSEYSSSARNASSGASNANLMSASGSGSGGNTGSGTGSGSNQGGSSGSGNDQGGMSSNGNGSSGSGNDKGSSEEMMDHTGEIPSAENSKGNDSFNSPNNTNNADAQDNTNLSRFSPNPSEPSGQRRSSVRSTDTQSQNAAREKKLQDKKRKRMNMRRVYEDQMEQDMGTSDSSIDQGEIRPGKPVTIDNAVSFTKTAKLVVKSNPSLTVIYTNAAYSRLSGIDSHSAMGNPITSFLSLPNRQTSQMEYQIEDPLQNNSTVKVNQTGNFDKMNEDNQVANSSKNHVAAEAAGRARAAASCGDNIPHDLENLIVACGNGKLNRINIRCKPHKMLGRKVKVFKSMVPMKRNQDEGSISSSITSSYDGPYNFVACNMSISPVISSPEIYANTTTTTKDKKLENHHSKSKRNEKEQDSHQQKSKRRKHLHTMNEVIHNRKRQVISHYVIQLEPHEADLTKNNSERGSHSSVSTGIEARMLGLAKVEARQQRVIPTKSKVESEVIESK